MIQPKFGYFDKPGQDAPAFDPGLNVECPVCQLALSRPMKTISLMLDDENLGGRDTRSYFYRVHKQCYEGLNAEEETALDSTIIDAVAASKYVN